MNANRPLAIRQLTPRSASTRRSPLWNDFVHVDHFDHRASLGRVRLAHALRSIVHAPCLIGRIDQCDPTRIASIGTSRAARQAG